MNDITNKNIQIDSIDAKMASTGNMKYILKDIERLKYFFWQKNKNVDSPVFQSFTSMGVKKGDSINIGYTEEDKSFVNPEGKTVNYTDRFILGLRESDGSIVSTPAKSPVRNDSSASGRYQDSQLHEINRQNREKTNEFWEQQAYEKCLSLWFNGYQSVPDGTAKGFEAGIQSGIYWDLFQAIKSDAKKRFFEFTPSVNEPLPEELPTIQVEEDVEAFVADIPF